MAILGFSDTLFNVGPALTAPGNGNLVQVAENDLLSTTDYTLITIVASIDTTVNVRLDGSIDGTNFAPIIADTQYNANGTFALSVSGRPVKFVRPVFTAEAGGTAAVVTFHVAAA